MSNWCLEVLEERGFCSIPNVLCVFAGQKIWHGGDLELNVEDD